MKNKRPTASRKSTAKESEETGDSRSLNNIPEEMWGSRDKWKPHEHYSECNTNGRLIKGPKHVKRHTEFESISCNGQRTRGGDCSRRVRVPSKLLEKVEQHDLDTATFAYCFCIFHQNQALIRPDAARTFRDAHRDLQTLSSGDRFEVVKVETGCIHTVAWDYEFNSPASVIDNRILEDPLNYLVIETNRGKIGALPGHCQFAVDELLFFDPDDFKVEVKLVQGSRVLVPHDNSDESDQMPDSGQRQTPAYQN